MENYRKKQIVSMIALGIVALAWGTSYAIIKDTLNNVRPFTLMSMRFGFSTILLSIIFAKRLKGIKKKELYNSSITGVFMFLSFFFLVTGISYTTASKQSFIVGAYVLIVPFLSWLINKKTPDIYSIIGAILATIGIGLLTVNGSFRINIGDTLSVFCSFFFACHMISIEHFNKESDPILSTIVQFGVTTILFLILTGIFESFDISFNNKLIRAVVYLVIVATVIPFVVQNVAQKYITSTSTALILSLETVFGGVFAVLLLKEKMSNQMVIGLIVILIAILIEETKLKFIKNRRTFGKL